jgi:CubicO group peptidase (beta-lactamase class C family)
VGSTTALIQEEMKRHNIQGLSIALVDGQGIVWARGFGFADVSNRVPAKPETVYPAGSIAKLFTVAAVLQLNEQKKIDIDQPLRDYLPEFSVRTRFSGSAPITIRSLMTHHSGLPSDYLKEMISLTPARLDDRVKGLRREWVAYPPDFVFSYSNVAFQLLGYLVERVSGIEFSSFMKESLFKPMGMGHTSFVLDPRIKPFLSKGYRAGRETEEILLPSVPSPDCPLYTSVVDLSRFIQMIFADGRAGDQQILKPGTLSKTLQRQNGDVRLDFDFQIGLGWFLNDSGIKGAGLVASHGGTLSLFHSQMTLLPEHKLGVVVLANSSSAIQVVNRIAEETLKSAVEEKAGIKQPEPQRIVREPNIPWPQAAIEDHVGHYATGLRVFTVEAEKGRLFTRLMGRRVELVLHPSGQFSLRYRLLGLIPVRLGPLEGMNFSVVPVLERKVLVLNYRGKRHLLGEKIEGSPVSEAWLRRTGEYELADPGSYRPVIEKAELKYEGPFLMLDVRIPILGDYGIERLKFAIRPVSDTEAILLGLGRNMGETLQVVEENGVEKIRYSGCEFVKKIEAPLVTPKIDLPMH